MEGVRIIHHGARVGVTGSCHEIKIGNYGILIDCGLFQGIEANGFLDIDFPVSHIQALLLTHCHIDHVGRRLGCWLRAIVVRFMPLRRRLLYYQ